MLCLVLCFFSTWLEVGWKTLSSLFCNIKGPETAPVKGCSLMKLYFASQWETQEWAKQKKNRVLLPWLILYLRLTNLLRKKLRYNKPLLPTSSPFKKNQNLPRPSQLLSNLPSTPTVPILSKRSEAQFYLSIEGKRNPGTRLGYF